MLQYFYMYFTYNIEGSGYAAIYTVIIVPSLLSLCVYNYSSLIPKVIEIYLTYDMLNNYTLKYTEYIYIFINILLNYIQLHKPIAMLIF
jgi:hypothetical protein